MEFLNRTKQIIRQYKLVFIIGIPLLLIVIIFIVASRAPEQEVPTLPPVIVKKESLEFVKATSPSGRRQTFDTLEIIVFDFSLPIDVKSLQLSTIPYIKLKPLYRDDYPNRLSLIPDGMSWQNNVEYKIVITSLNSTTGNKLSKPVEYIYHNIPPNIDPTLTY